MQPTTWPHRPPTAAWRAHAPVAATGWSPPVPRRPAPRRGSVAATVAGVIGVVAVAVVAFVLSLLALFVVLLVVVWANAPATC